MLVPRTTVTQLLFVSAAKFNFAHVVQVLQTLLTDLGHGPAQVTWDCDEAVSLRTDKVTVLVGCGDGLPVLAAQHLTFVLAPVEGCARISKAEAAQIQRLDTALTDAMTKRYRPDRVIRAQSELPPHADLLDTLARSLMATTLAEQSVADRFHGFRGAVSDAEVLDCMGRMPLFPGQSPKKGRPKSRGSIWSPATARDLPQVRRSAAPETSLAMRIATQAFNLTLAVVWLPLGVVLLAHACLHGSDLRRSAQAMVLAGLFSAAFNLQALSEMSLLGRI